MRDPLFLVCCACYGVNRWLLKPSVDSLFLHSWFNDLLLAPCAMPVVLWLFRKLGVRASDEPPSILELGWIVAVWSVLFEWMGPRIIGHATGDWRDVLMYISGAVVAWIYWRAPWNGNGSRGRPELNNGRAASRQGSPSLLIVRS